MDIGTRLFTMLRGQAVGTDATGNRYFQERRPRAGVRQRRWVLFNGPKDASVVPAEWHAWLHHTVDAPLAASARRVWQKPHLPNLTGTALAYRPPGHDYKGGHRAPATGDYEAWSPEGDTKQSSPEGGTKQPPPEGDKMQPSQEGNQIQRSPEAGDHLAAPAT
jgi:NADH:ubiquinone oxidoreductase subunit